MNVKKIIYLLAMAVLMNAQACTKTAASCENVAPATEEAAMQSFMASKGIVAEKMSNGLYYQIIEPGSATHPTVFNTVFVTYTGTLLNGTVFDQQANPGQTGFPLSTLVEGWKLGLQKIGKGGKILLVVPSSLGYGCKGSGTSIPSNSPIYFEVTLVDFY